MHYRDADGTVILENANRSLYFPRWQTSPYLQEGVVNENLERHDQEKEILLHVWDSATAVVGGYLFAPPGDVHAPNPMTAMFAALLSVREGEEVVYRGDPMATLYLPIFDSFDDAARKPVGVLSTLVDWRDYFRNILPTTVSGIVVVLDYECGTTGFVHDHAEATHEDEDGELHSEVEEEEGHDDHDHRVLRRQQRQQRERRDLTTFTMINHENGSASVVTTTTNNTDDYYYLGEDGHDDEHADEHEDEDEEHADEHADEHDEEGHEEEHEDDHDDHDDENESGHEGHEEGNSTGFTYMLDGSEAHVVGYGDLHDRKFDKWAKEAHLSSQNLDDGTVVGIPLDQRCAYHLHVYPSQEFYDHYITGEPVLIAFIIASVFIFTILTFIFYNYVVERRQEAILNQATKSAAIVQSLFPKV